MAIFVLFSATYISVDFHVCRDKVRSFQFFGKAIGCDGNKGISGCEQTNNNSEAGFSKKPCCSHITLFSKSNIESISPLVISAQPLLNMLLSPRTKNKSVIASSIVPFFQIDPKPQLHGRQLHLVYQVFLI